MGAFSKLIKLLAIAGILFFMGLSGEEKDRKKKRIECQNEWKDIWGEIWVTSIPYSGDESLHNKR